MEFFTTIQSIGILQGVLIGIFLLTVKKANIKANFYLSINIFSLSIAMFLHLISDFNTFLINNHVIYVNIISFLYFPLLLLYIKNLTISNYPMSFKRALHFTPFLFFLVSSPFLDRVLSNYNITLLLIANIALYLQFLVYLVLFLKTLISYKKSIKKSYSTLSKVSLNWLWVLVTLFSVICFISLFIEFLYPSYMDIVWILITLLIYTSGYFALWQPQIFKSENTGLDSGSKYKKSSLTNSLTSSYIKKLNTVLDRDKPYLNGNITLPDLAGSLGISTHHLSQIINQKYNKNFFDFINFYRIEEAKYLLKKSENKYKKIIEIGFESGFNSVSSFNKAFKSFTSVTPSSYRSMHSSL